MEFLGARGSVLFGYMYVGYEKAAGIYDGFYVETRSNDTSCVTGKQHSRFEDCSEYRFIYSVALIFRLQVFKGLIFESS